MSSWTRWQDWAAGIVGLYAALATIWTVQTGASMSLMIIFGVLVIIAALVNLALPDRTQIEWFTAVMAALLFASPWMGAYWSHAGAAWTSWVCGAIGVIVSVSVAMAPWAHMGSSRHIGPQAT